MKKILVIEDQPLVRANLVEILELEEFDVVGAENGLFGTLWAQEHLPDLIICDVPTLDKWAQELGMSSSELARTYALTR